ncbi:MAG: UbiD family decarboxylase [Burkholderiales bacterium]
MATVAYKDLREFIELAKQIDSYKIIEGADWNEEIGTLTEVTCEHFQDPPLLIFDKIKDYPPGYRVVGTLITSHKRWALALGLPLDCTRLETARNATRKIKASSPIPPREVKTGPVMENIMTGDDIDLLKFPVPLFHKGDGGRYIGTGCTVINKDPESGYVNMGTYRLQVHEKNLMGLWISPGQQGRIIAQRYWERGESCPIVCTFGIDPLTFMSSYTIVPWGKSELDFAGGMRGEPIDVIKGPLTGLPIPAYAEIAIEGEVPPPSVEKRAEGPFGEWPGYYSGGTQGTGEDQPVIRVKAIYHRNDPILHNQTPNWPGAVHTAIDFRAGLLWDQLESAGVPGIKGVYMFNPYFVVVSIQQQYAGHAKQAGHAVIGCAAGARQGRYTVVVDEDIDPTKLKEVLWAIWTRADPAEDIDAIAGCWNTPLDPRMPPDKRNARDYTTGRCIIYAVRPFAWRDKFPKTSRSEPELRRRIMEKYKDMFNFPSV